MDSIGVTLLVHPGGCIQRLMQKGKESEEPAMRLGKRKRGISCVRSRSRDVEADEDVIPPVLHVENPEDGWDNRTEAKCVVLQYKTMREVELLVFEMDFQFTWSKRAHKK